MTNQRSANAVMYRAFLTPGFAVIGSFSGPGQERHQDDRYPNGGEIAAMAEET
jgi:hypothetical protein